jgi:glutamate-1-semialdehyde aminotransferase
MKTEELQKLDRGHGILLIIDEMIAVIEEGLAYTDTLVTRD